MPSRVASWEFRRGRQDELEKTGTGEATIHVHDVDGLYDPTNSSSPYFGQLDGVPVSLSLRNPVTDTWHTRFTGIADEYTFDLSGSQRNQDVTIHCVDGFDYLATAEMTAGLHGTLPIPAEVGAAQVFYDDAEVDERIHQILTDASWPAGRRKIFTGNVVCQETIYDSGYSFLAGLHDATDSEFPGVSQVYIDAVGDVVFHGRHARFDPDNTANGANWVFTRWKVGDGTAIAGDNSYAQARPPLVSDRSLKMVFNAALIYPAQVENDETTDEYEALIAANISLDEGSIDQFGVRSYTAQDLRILRHKTTGGDRWVQTKAMADYYTINYAQPRLRPRQITVKSVYPTDGRAAATWAFLCGVEISDIIHLKVEHPGGGGIDEDFYVEGISCVVRPLQVPSDSSGGFDYVEVTCDVSPTAYWTEDTFTIIGGEQ